MALKGLKESARNAAWVLCWYAVWFTLVLVFGIPAYLLVDLLPPQLILLWCVALVPCTAFMTHALMPKLAVIFRPLRDDAKTVTVIRKGR